MSIARALIALSAVLFAFSVQAAPATIAPTPWDSVDVTVHEEDGRAIMIISGELPESATLPAEVELAVPSGAQMQWAGEVLGGPVDQDPSVQYRMVSEDGLDIYAFTLAKSRLGQIEVVPQGLVTAVGDGFQSSLNWTSASDVRELRLNFRVQQNSKVLTPAAGATMEAGPPGYSYYSRVITDVKAGQTESLVFSYSPPAASPGGAPASAASSGSIVLVLVLSAVVLCFGLLAMNVRKKMQLKSVAPTRPSVAKRSTPGTQSRGAAPASSTLPGRGETAHVAESRSVRRIGPVVPMLFVVGALVAGFAIAGTKGTSATVIDGKISRSFGAASACQSSSMAIAPSPGVDLADKGDELLKAFEGMEGVGDVSIDVARSRIDMAWCESSQSEDSMRQALAMTGLVTMSESGGVPATGSSGSSATSAAVDASGKRQTLAIDTSSGSFSPNQVTLVAGVPTEITFGQAAGCLSEVVIAELGVNQDLTAGSATVELPALDPGTYAFACGMGHQSGQLVVQ